MKSISDIKKSAKCVLRNNYWTCFAVSLIVSVLIGLPNAILIIGTIIIFIIVGALKLGEWNYYYNSYDNPNTANVGDIFYAFNKGFGKAIGLYWLKGIFVFFWTLLLIIPGIVKSFAYSMSEFLMIKFPELTPCETISLSRRLMKNNKGKLFGLYVSFIGWYLLCILTLGIGFIFLIPYLNMSKTVFIKENFTEDDIISVIRFMPQKDSFREILRKADEYGAQEKKKDFY